MNIFNTTTSNREKNRLSTHTILRERYFYLQSSLRFFDSHNTHKSVFQIVIAQIRASERCYFDIDRVFFDVPYSYRRKILRRRFDDMFTASALCAVYCRPFYRCRFCGLPSIEVKFKSLVFTGT